MENTSHKSSTSKSRDHVLRDLPVKLLIMQVLKEVRDPCQKWEPEIIKSTMSIATSLINSLG
jgi:hypothetical protein